MMNTKNLWMTTMALLLAGCNSVDLGFVPLYAINPEVDVDDATGVIKSCTFNPGANPMAFIAVDVSQQAALSLYVAAENRLQTIGIPLQTDEPSELIAIPNHIQPVRFDYRWECDSDGFTAAQGPLRVPAFGADRAFCLDKRDDATRNFAGFNVVPATGASIAPETVGAIEVRIAPPQMLASIGDSFEVSVLADRCCNEAGSCNDANLALPSCAALQAVFDRVGAKQGVEDGPNLAQWRSFVYHTSATPNVSVNAAGGSIPRPVPYNMRLRGRFEGLTATGDLITSTDWVQDIGFCEGCGTSAALFCLDQ